MKKSFFGFLVLSLTFFLFLNFKSTRLTKKLLPQINLTLNGFDGPTAVQMIKNFADRYDKDKGLKSVSAFYTIGQLDTIKKLLEFEHADSTIQTDGLRIYFGSDLPTGTNTKLRVKIFLVSTKKRTVHIDSLSDHVDYYLHPTGMLSPVEIADAIRDSGMDVLNAGGRLYEDNPSEPTSVCAQPSGHYLRNGLAHDWVRARYENGGKDDSPYNTKSDWFGYEFIDEFFKAITNRANNFSGLRIYLGKGPADEKGIVRDVFILVPTKKDSNGHNKDDYNCLEDLPGVHFPISDTSGFDGGYDKGELCPYKCN